MTCCEIPKRCCEPKPCPTVLDFVGEALAHLTNADNLDIPADVRGARAVRVLSELATRLEQGLL